MSQSLIGHVVSEGMRDVGTLCPPGSGCGTYYPGIQEWRYYPGDREWHWETDIQVGKFVYSLLGVDKKIHVGAYCLITIESDKHGNPKKLDVTLQNGKVHKFRVLGKAEAK